MAKIALKAGTPKWEMFGQIFPELGVIFFDIVLWLERKGYKTIVITSMIRPKVHDSGIHETGRAMDIGCTFPDAIGDELMEYINFKYPYDNGASKYDTIIRHEIDSYDDAGKHYHIQVGWEPK